MKKLNEGVKWVNFLSTEKQEDSTRKILKILKLRNKKIDKKDNEIKKEARQEK
jgi:hypothetical protein